MNWAGGWDWKVADCLNECLNSLLHGHRILSWWISIFYFCAREAVKHFHRMRFRSVCFFFYNHLIKIEIGYKCQPYNCNPKKISNNQLLSMSQYKKTISRFVYFMVEISCTFRCNMLHFIYHCSNIQCFPVDKHTHTAQTPEIDYIRP